MLVNMRYSLYSLYWYKTANTDAAQGHAASVGTCSVSICSFVGDMAAPCRSVARERKEEREREGEGGREGGREGERERERKREKE